MKCLFLYNPMSGRGKIKKRLSLIRSMLSEKYETDIVETKSGADMEERARAAVGKYDLIVFSGGDGTFHNVLQGIGEADMQLGYIPAGTVNDVARSLGIPRRIKGALKVILGGRSEQLDCMRINGTHNCMYVAALGTATNVTYETSQRSKRALGWFAYAFRGIRRNMRFRVFRIHGVCDGREFAHTGVLALVMNGRSVAGFKVNRGGSMQDGQLEVAIVKQKERPNLFQKLGAYFVVVGLMLGGIKRKRKRVAVYRGAKLFIGGVSDMVWDFDGERGVAGDIEAEVMPRRVRMMVPAQKKV